MTTGALRIALVGHLRHPIGRPFMGGMEAHSWHLARALVRRGHDVTVLASGDSDVPGQLHPVLPRHYDAELPWHDWHGTDRLNALLDASFAGVVDALADGGFDVVHNNSLHRYPPRFARRDGVPMLTSLHVPPFGPLRRAVHGSAAPWSHFTTCSQLQRRRWWPDGAPAQAHVVPNGIDLGEWPFVPRGDGSAVWSGRITPNKGAPVAIEAARRADLPLTLFGAIEHRDHFEDEIRPRLGDGIRYGGHLPQTELAAEIGRASVLLFTPLWDEPFGLVAAEAMAAGVPVAAIGNGAVAEVVGEAGAIADRPDAAALARAIPAACAVPRRVAHDRAAARFSLDAMIDAYTGLYARAMAGRPADGPPRVGFAPHELPRDTGLRIA